MKTSIKIKKMWVAEVAADGGPGLHKVELQTGIRESTFQFNGSDAEGTSYKNILGKSLERSFSKGDKTVTFQLADLSADILAMFCGGTVTEDTDAIDYDFPENENQSIELSISFLTDKNVLVLLPRVQVDGFPMLNDDDLHYYQINGTVMSPEKEGVPSVRQSILKTLSANDITVFTLPKQSATATISTVTHTVAISVPSGTSVTALVPTIDVSKGASITPGSGIAKDFTAPVVYTVTAVDGTEQEWTVTVTILT